MLAVKKMRGQHEWKHIVHLDFEVGQWTIKLDGVVHGFVMKVLYNAFKYASLNVFETRSGQWTRCLAPDA